MDHRTSEIQNTQRKLNFPREISFTWIAVVVTLIATVMFLRHTWQVAELQFQEGGFRGVVEPAVFVAIICFLIYGNLVYQGTRLGYLNRLNGHRPTTREELERIYEDEAPSLALLIPSYKEESRIIRQTILSAALQEYPRRRVVLLIDDPPHPSDPHDLASLEVARKLPEEVQSLLGGPAGRLDAALADFMKRHNAGGIILGDECLNLARLYTEVADWLDAEASRHPITDHTDAWFVKKILREPAEVHRQRANSLASLAHDADSYPSNADVLREYNRLATLFRVEITSFERKRYANLSHEPNKAMNLNSYIGLLGRSFNEVWRNGHCYFEEMAHGKDALCIPDADYLITLDADSLLLPDYALRLVHVMEQPGNERLAVAQAPYNAIPGAAGILERIAGATTDIQHIIHQGFTRHDATYWVGANALLRRVALEDIKVTEEERGFTITRYIQDRTVIEDTESSIDLVCRGWRLYNYPERLAYSATPPDFGALLIQRRRWANGGLIILPKLMRYLLGSPASWRSAGEGAMRFHYLTSIAGANIGLLAILAYPFSENLSTIWLPIIALCYYLLYGRDMVHMGYRMSDLLRMYAFNLLLIPVNLGGVFKSIQQGWTGKKIPFTRTPKVVGRTAAPAFYILAEYMILAYCIAETIENILRQRWSHAIFALVNGGFLAYAVTRFIGWRESSEDLALAWRELDSDLMGLTALRRRLFSEE